MRLTHLTLASTFGHVPQVRIVQVSCDQAQTATQRNCRTVSLQCHYSVTTVSPRLHWIRLDTSGTFSLWNIVTSCDTLWYVCLSIGLWSATNRTCHLITSGQRNPARADRSGGMYLTCYTFTWWLVTPSSLSDHVSDILLFQEPQGIRNLTEVNGAQIMRAPQGFEHHFSKTMIIVKDDRIW